MTAPLPFTQASIRRRIAAAKSAGLRVKGIASDGTVLVDDGDKPASQVDTSEATHSKWQDSGT